MNKLLDLMRQLRDPETGCTWDKKQTLASIVPHTLEEAYEVADAIDRQHMPDLKEELGDLLFQIVFYAQIAQEQGEFDFDDIVDALHSKMTYRHPHVFGNKKYANETEQKADWDTLKQNEKALQDTDHKDYFADITQGLTALQRGQKILKRAAKQGFDWPDWRPVVDKLHEEVEEIIEAVENNEPIERIEEELGDLLIVVNNLARHFNVNTENAARLGNQKFTRRFNQMMQVTKENNPNTDHYSLEQMDKSWKIIKQQEKHESS